MFLDTIAIAFWPVVVGLVLIGWRGRADPNILAPAWAAASLIGIAGIMYTVIFDITSLVVLFNATIGMMLFGTLCLLTVYGARSRLTRRQCVGITLLGIALIGCGSEELIGDHVLERQTVDAVVRQLRIHETAKGPNEYLVTIGDQTFKATTRLYATLRQGDRVRATIGRGSGYIYGVEKL
jgi:hypothetical protein